MSKFRYLLHQLRSKLWLKPALTGLAAVAWVQLAYFSSSLLPDEMPVEIGRDLLLSLLQILASTMLTVAIFAVSAMVAAFASVSTTATPRATRIVMQDRSSQNALAAFLSAFIYAIVALVAISATAYGAGGRLILFAGYVLTVLWVLVSFVRWVDQVSKLGRMSDTIRRVEEACHAAFTDPRLAGSLGACPAEEPATAGEPVFAGAIGYVQHLDVEGLQEIAVKAGATLHVLVRPGAFIDRHRPLALLEGALPAQEDWREHVAAAFTIGDERHVESDPRCGLLMLAEIADRALSPAVNDPGTAIAVIGSQVRLLSEWADATRRSPDCEYPDVTVPPLRAGDLLEDGFTPIARDGAGIFEVGVRLQKALGALARLGNAELREAALFHSRLALEQAEQKLGTRFHLDRLRKLAPPAGTGG
jgi:uncharacterized membrane protein